MKDFYSDKIDNAKTIMDSELQASKNQFIKEIKNGLGEQMIKELENNNSENNTETVSFIKRLLFRLKILKK